MNCLFPWLRSDRPRRSVSRADYAGAVYGSLLASSVIATASAVGDFPRIQVVVLLLVTGVVFWAAHVYASLAGARLVGQPVGWAEVRGAARHESLIVQAAVLPAMALAVSPLLGLEVKGAGWLALAVAVAQQVAWALLGALKAGASRSQAAVEGTVNLTFGLVIVSAKAALGH
ncbi:hypothetical protein [Streptomyces gardneri]|uniref:hypothetical protein n=1 Tax=Streptomyces gardneri TaxID=66892 RepID=UPI0006BC1F85|nr:hypothetical protein [Streptomyces gardneri]WRK41148.1 hypothetical protein U0M97_36915 [Streptomyces venezuelae]CUM36439.1 putative integral membrane protein [Streptomyces venezuelae]